MCITFHVIIVTVVPCIQLRNRFTMCPLVLSLSPYFLLVPKHEKDIERCVGVLRFYMMDTNGLKTCPLLTQSHLTIWAFAILKPTDCSLLSKAVFDVHKS